MELRALGSCGVRSRWVPAPAPRLSFPGNPKRPGQCLRPNQFQPGTILLGRRTKRRFHDRKDRSQLEELFKFQQHLGLDSSWCTAMYIPEVRHETGRLE